MEDESGDIINEIGDSISGVVTAAAYCMGFLAACAIEARKNAEATGRPFTNETLFQAFKERLLEVATADYAATWLDQGQGITPEAAQEKAKKYLAAQIEYITSTRVLAGKMVGGLNQDELEESLRTSRLIGDNADLETIQYLDQKVEGLTVAAVVAS